VAKLMCCLTFAYAEGELTTISGAEERFSNGCGGNDGGAFDDDEPPLSLICAALILAALPGLGLVA